MSEGVVSAGGESEKLMPVTVSSDPLIIIKPAGDFMNDEKAVSRIQLRILSRIKMFGTFIRIIYERFINLQMFFGDFFPA